MRVVVWLLWIGLMIGWGITGCGQTRPSESDEPANQATGTPQDVGGRHALLIGISRYARGGDPDSEWWNVHGTNDVDAMEQTLRDRFGFPPENITVLRDGAASREKIEEAFQKLINRTRAGDTVYFHYSGHGQQIPDVSGEEIDHWAQSIVPFDYKSRSDFSHNISNREFRVLIAALKRKNPANITLVFDCCFAGGISKGGEETIRGAAWVGGLPKSPASANVQFGKGSIGIFPPARPSRRDMSSSERAAMTKWLARPPWPRARPPWGC